MRGCIAFCALCLIVAPLAAIDPLDLARGLREIGQPDLAIEYLNDLTKKNPAADVKIVLPLERAKCLLAAAQMESEEAAREGGVAQAKATFENFLKANPKHPRVPEAQLALAQVTAVQAVGQLNRTAKITGPNATETKKRRTEAILATRPLFVKASSLFGEASKGLAAQLSSAGDESRQREIRKTSLQAELDRGINQYRLVDTYPSDVQGKDVLERGAELDKARNIFLALGKRDDTNPVCWQARAWAGMCEYDKSDRAAAQKIFKQVLTDGAKNPAGADGIRMVEFFETFIKYFDAVGDPNPKSVGAARNAAKNWLEKDRYRPRMTPERLRMTFYYAYLTELLGQAEVVFEKPAKGDDKPAKMKSVSNSGIVYLKEAAREYKRLLDFDNEYTERATENRNRTTRIIVGDSPREPKFYTDLEECQMAGMVQLIKANDAREEAQKVEESDQAQYDLAQAKEKAEFAKAIALMARAKHLLNSSTPPNEVAETKFNQAFAFFAAGQYPLAAVSGDALARSGRGSIAARGGYVGVESYLRSRERQDENADAAAKASDRDRAVALAYFLDKSFPTDPATDNARLRLGQLFAKDDQFQASFDLLGRISPSFSDVAVARAIQGRVAYLLIAAKDTPLTDAQKAAVFKKAVADCEAVAEPAGGAPLKAYFAVRTLLGNLHLSNRPNGYADAEKVAADNMKQIAASNLEVTDKKALLFSADEVRLRAVYAQAFKQFEEGNYKAMLDKMLPMLGEMNAADRAASADLQGEAGSAAASLDNFRREFVVLAMQGRLREGEFEKAAGLFELLDKLGGTVDATSAALNRFVSLVRPQVERLRKAKKDGDADKLTSTVGALLQKQASKDKLPLRVQASLGRSLRDLGQNDKAIEVLKKVPAPNADKLAMNTTALEEADREAVIAYQIAQIELARAYRSNKNFGEADKVLLGAIGDEKAKPPVKGWAKSREFRKEAVLLLEDKAANLPAEPKDARSRAWVEAKKGWETIALQYAGAIRNKELPPNEREKLIPVYLDVLCDLRRCIARGNSQIIADPAKLAESMTKIGQQVHEIETANPTALNAEVKAKYRELLADYPAMKAEYQKRGGKAFLDETGGN